MLSFWISGIAIVRHFPPFRVFNWAQDQRLVSGGIVEPSIRYKQIRIHMVFQGVIWIKQPHLCLK